MEEASTGWQLLEMGIPLSILVVLLAFLATLFGAGMVGYAAVGTAFICAGPHACDNPIALLMKFLFAFIASPPLILATILEWFGLEGGWIYDLYP